MVCMHCTWCTCTACGVPHVVYSACSYLPGCKEQHMVYTASMRLMLRCEAHAFSRIKAADAQAGREEVEEPNRWMASYQTTSALMHHHMQCASYGLHGQSGWRIERASTQVSIAAWARALAPDSGRPRRSVYANIPSDKGCCRFVQLTGVAAPIALNGIWQDAMHMFKLSGCPCTVGLYCR